MWHDTYIMMAKLGGDKPEVRLRRYEECIADLKVTHSPRFYLNMDLEEGEDYLTRNDAKDLLELSGDDLNRKIRKLLRTQKSTWWSGGETTAFSDLSKEEKNIYLNEGIALFPEVFKGDYHNFTPWLVYSCFVWCGNVRDIFSAGGNKFIDDSEIYVSAVMYRALENAQEIKLRIFDMTDEEMTKFWGSVIEDKVERVKYWLGLVQQNLRFSNDLMQNNLSYMVLIDDDTVDRPARLLFRKTQDCNVFKRKKDWLIDKLHKYSLNFDKCRKLILVVVTVLPECKLEFIIEFLKDNKNIEDFKKIYLFPMSCSRSGSEVPLILKKIEFLKLLKDSLKGIDYIEHRKYLEELCMKYEKYKEEVELREYIEDADYA